MNKRNILVFVGSRANYSSIKSVMLAIKNHPDLNLQTVVGASAILDRFGKVEDLLIKDGFKIDARFYNLIEGENPVTMAKSTGLGLIEASSILDALDPEFVVIVGDRFEMMSVVIAAAYQNIKIAHTMGGEVTGTIDESIRHAITKFSHLHFPANEDARERIIKMGEHPNDVFNFGCPRIDLIRHELAKSDSIEELKGIFDVYGGVGGSFDLNSPFLLVSQHPVTTEFVDARAQFEETLIALNKLKMPTILLWPNADAGSDDISKAIRTFREKYNPEWLHLFKNLPTSIYIHLLNTTACLIGNSSSGLRDAAFVGTPVVNIGTRQKMRMKGENVIDAKNDSTEIFDAISTQLSHGRYKSSDIYGDGYAGKKIAQCLSEFTTSIQKTINY
ncbi:UDP-N-acetylglucosamine 2-epimerase [Vibrio sp. Isolate25]|uniref:UDP-N-acetylglucosamine 2-epimerase n=1 Tax=Vibrio sp. Isolate25 TaxID=2908535 RepID=UPI001EFED9E2|nr:UDP-N-acetylglucosamine 2-epimerase [Vibrio sp. Isolate25]MCG9597825.1 UDP-N-acetylglucosamine 2-epimerase [Vibrio sp. Isolate25]